MKDFEITHMIIDDQIGEEYVTADFTYSQKDYSITFKKADLEMINSWVFEGSSSLPANLSEEMIEALRMEIKKEI